MLLRLQERDHLTYLLLVRVQNRITTREICVKVPQKDGKIDLTHAALEHIPNGRYILP